MIQISEDVAIKGRSEMEEGVGHLSTLQLGGKSDLQGELNGNLKVDLGFSERCFLWPSYKLLVNCSLLP